MELVIERNHRHWWVFIVRGILFAGLGVYMIAEPIGSFIALGFLFGLILFLTGVAELLRVVRERTQKERSWHLLLGILDIVLGLALMVHVATSMAIIRVLLGLFFIFRGISLFSHWRHRRESWMVLAGAILVFVFGLLILFDATFGDMTIILWTAIAFIIVGIFNVLLGYSLKQS